MFVVKICLLHKMTLFYLTSMIDKSPKIRLLHKMTLVLVFLQCIMRVIKSSFHLKLERLLASAHCLKVQKYNGAKQVSNFSICGADNAVEHYGEMIKILQGCPFEEKPNRSWPSHPFRQKGLGWACPVWSVLKRTPMQDFQFFFHNVLLH